MNACPHCGANVCTCHGAVTADTEPAPADFELRRGDEPSQMIAPKTVTNGTAPTNGSRADGRVLAALGMTPRPPTAQQVHDAKQEHINRRFREFVQQLGKEIGEPPMGALAVIHWVKGVSVGMAVPDMPPQQMMNVLDRLGDAVPNVVKQIKRQIEKTKNLIIR